MSSSIRGDAGKYLFNKLETQAIMVNEINYGPRSYAVIEKRSADQISVTSHYSIYLNMYRILTTN